MDLGLGTVLPICEIQLAQDTSFVSNNNELQYCTHQKQESLVLFFFAFFFIFFFITAAVPYVLKVLVVF